MNLTSLIEKTEKELVALGKRHLSTVGTACHVLGKIFFALGKLTPANVALSKFILDSFGVARVDVPRQAWSVAVCAAHIGEGMGKFGESDFDKTPARWLAVASAIYNLLEKAEADKTLDAAKAAGFREQVALVVRERPTNGQTVLESLRDALKPQGAGKGGAGEREGENGAGEGGEEILPPESLAMESLKNTANLIAAASFDSVQIKALRRTFCQVGKLIRLKAKAATPAPIAPVTVETTAAGPTIVPAPAPMVSMGAALAAATPAKAVPRKRRGQAAALAA